MGIRGLDGARWDLYPRGSFWRSAPTEAAGRRDRANGKNGEMTPWRARPPKRSLEWAAASLGPGSRVISARLLDQGGWHANHAVTVVDARHVSHRLVLRRWARPGWALGDPDFTAAREVEVLKLLERNRIPHPHRPAEVGPQPQRARLRCPGPAHNATAGSSADSVRRRGELPAPARGNASSHPRRCFRRRSRTNLPHLRRHEAGQRSNVAPGRPHLEACPCGRAEATTTGRDHVHPSRLSSGELAMVAGPADGHS